ncbi:MAG: undecaprenyl-diphosphate phosphatase [Methylotenera sp.]|nr:undecaprenyl-diphosphate phosphatase [Oligoflexia bacterium]
MNLFQIIILAVVQGLAELLPVSSSAHVIVAQRLMGIDPTTPEMTLLLVMLHTGTMFAVILHFRKQWQKHFQSRETFLKYAKAVILATAVTGIIGLALKSIIEKVFMSDVPHAEIEHLFGNLLLIACSLFAAGTLIFIAGSRDWASKGPDSAATGLSGPRDSEITVKDSLLMGAVQGLCLPFRGFSRSGATISTGLMSGLSRLTAEEFSFALAVVLTPPVVLRELLRLSKAHALSGSGMTTTQLLSPGLLGMVFSFLAGLVALRFLSQLLEAGKWKFFGIYCWVASLVVFGIHLAGF